MKNNPLFQYVWEAVPMMKQMLQKKNISTFASSAAFFLFVSMIPMLALLCAMIPFTGITKSDLMIFMTELTPDAMDAVMISMVEAVYGSSAGIASIAALTLLWSSGKGMMALIRGFNEINDVVESRGYIALRILASFYTALLLLVTVLTLIVMVFGNVVIYILCRTLPGLEEIYSLLMNLRLFFTLAVMIVIFSLMYACIPDKKMNIPDQLPGAVFTAVVWNLFSWGFSVYVETMGGFSLYGNLSAIVMLMLWLYMCIYIMMAGACLNRMHDRR